MQICRPAQTGRFVAALVLLSLSACSVQYLDRPPVVLSDNWKLQDQALVTADPMMVSDTQFDDSSWIAATVPGTVLSSLVNDGVYPEPLFGENNRAIPDSLAQTSYWYRTMIDVPKDITGKHIWLDFDGINYKAEVWVNEAQVGTIDGAFARGAFDVTSFVKPGKAAAIAVRIDPPPHPGTHAEKTIASGTGPNGGILAEDGPTFLSTIGWDWIPTIRDRDIGIWQNVSLRTTGPVVIENPQVVSDLAMPKMDSATITVSATLHNVTGKSQSGTLIGTVEKQKFKADYRLQGNESHIVSSTLKVDKPRLWWPNGYGNAELYSLHLACDVGSAESDAKDVSFGIRHVEYSVAGSENLTISVNGVPIMVAGGDWGMDEAMKRIPRGRLEAAIRMHKLANLNMIRNWVGQSTSEDFYDLCDKYGIMVWDEFFQPNRSDGPNPSDVTLYLANVREKVLRFRNHPSIVIWCGRNESNPAPAELASGIAKIMSELDPSRLYHPNSADGRGVRSGGPYSWQTPEAYYTPRTLEPFKTEIGSVSIPTLESIRAMMPRQDWETIDDDWAEHDLTRGAAEGRGRTPMYAEMLARRYGTIENLPDFVRKAQLANYEAFRAMYESPNAKMFQPYTGILTWMSNPAQPSFVWQLYAHDLEPNSALFAVKKACEPIHIQMNQDNFHVMVINHTPRAFSGTAIVKIVGLDGTVTLLPARPVASAGAESATDLGAINFPATRPASVSASSATEPSDSPKVQFVKLELRNASGDLVSDNFYWRNGEDADDLTSLNSLGEAFLTPTQLNLSHAGGICYLEVTVTNESPVVALMAHVQLRKLASGERVLPAYYADNYVSILPGETHTFHAAAAEGDTLEQFGPTASSIGKVYLALDGWNVHCGSFPAGIGTIGIQQNDDADPNSEPRGIFQANLPSTQP